MKISLEKWAEKNFDPAPAVKTVRTWARDGKIYPTPVKVGRAYYVEESAIFQNGIARPSLASRIPQ